MKTYIITGSAGLLGSRLSHLLLQKGHIVVGIDNNSREKFFGKRGSVESNLEKLKNYENYYHITSSILDEDLLYKVSSVLDSLKFDTLHFVHSAAQPAHDYPTRGFKERLEDFRINGEGTLRMLELYRELKANGIFVHISTDKVYGYHSIDIPLVETHSRFTPKDPHFKGFTEETPLDKSSKSFFGTSKLVGDLYAQEYAYQYDLPIVIFRSNCITGYSPTGVPLHGFLSYLVRALFIEGEYTINGYKGKQVRVSIDADIYSKIIDHVIDNFKGFDIYNIACLPKYSHSILEAIGYLLKKPADENLLNSEIEFKGKKIKVNYREQPRHYDYKFNIYDLTKLTTHYPATKEFLEENTLDYMFNNIFSSYGLNYEEIRR